MKMDLEIVLLARQLALSIDRRISDDFQEVSAFFDENQELDNFLRSPEASGYLSEGISLGEIEVPSPSIFQRSFTEDQRQSAVLLLEFGRKLIRREVALQSSGIVNLRVKLSFLVADGEKLFPKSKREKLIPVTHFGQNDLIPDRSFFSVNDILDDIGS